MKNILKSLLFWCICCCITPVAALSVVNNYEDQPSSVQHAEATLSQKQLNTIDALMLAIKKGRTDEQQKKLLEKLMPMIAGFKRKLPNGAKRNLAIVLEAKMYDAHILLSKNEVSNGDHIKVWYTGSTEGTIFDTNRESVAQESGIYNQARIYVPLEFTVGEGVMIPGFEKGVLGMREGEKKTLFIGPEDGYGIWKQDLVQSIPLTNFESGGLQPAVGESYNFGIAQGVIIAIENDMVTIDFNHMLSGKELMFEVEVVEIS